MTTEPTPEPTEETTEETTRDLHVEGESIVVETTPEGGQKITATDTPGEPVDDDDPAPGAFPR